MAACSISKGLMQPLLYSISFAEVSLDLVVDTSHPLFLPSLLFEIITTFKTFQAPKCNWVSKVRPIDDNREQKKTTLYI